MDPGAKPGEQVRERVMLPLCQGQVHPMAESVSRVVERGTECLARSLDHDILQL